MKKLLSVGFALSLVLGSQTSVFAADNNTSNQPDANSIVKEIEEGVYVPKDDSYSFEEINNALMEIQSKIKEKRIKEDAKEAGKDYVTAQDGELLGGTHWYFNPVVGFNSIAVTASMNWSAGVIKSSWDYQVQGYSNPKFSQAKVKTWIKLYGLEISTSPVTSTYSYSSPYVYNTTTVARAGSGYDYGAWAAATSGAEFTAAPYGSTSFRTYNY